jgi:hypothetical protein
MLLVPLASDLYGVMFTKTHNVEISSLKVIINQNLLTMISRIVLITCIDHHVCPFALQFDLAELADRLNLQGQITTHL